MTVLDYDRDIAPKKHRLHVVRYDQVVNAHVCTVEDDPRHIRVDLFIDGDFNDDISPESLIGKTVEVEYTHGYLFLAHNVRLVDEAPAEPAARTADALIAASKSEAHHG